MSNSPLKIAMIALVNEIPYGYVSSYGVIGRILSDQLQQNVPAKIVGFLLSSMPAHERSSCCWRRVISKSGHISALKLWEKGHIQATLLQNEGIEVNEGRVNMLLYAYEFPKKQKTTS